MRPVIAQQLVAPARRPCRRPLLVLSVLECVESLAVVVRFDLAASTVPVSVISNPPVGGGEGRHPRVGSRQSAFRTVDACARAPWSAYDSSRRSRCSLDARTTTKASVLGLIERGGDRRALVAHASRDRPVRAPSGVHVCCLSGIPDKQHHPGCALIWGGFGRR